MQTEPERGDDAEVAAAASQRPEQIGVFVGGRPDDAALGGDHIRGEQVVDGEPVFAHEEADAAAEGEPGDAGVAHDAAGGGQTVGLRLVVDVAPQSTALHMRRAAGRVDPHGPHRREVDEDPVVAHRGAGHVVPPPRTAISRSRSRAKATAATTSATPVQRAMQAGWRSIAPFQISRAAS